MIATLKRKMRRIIEKINRFFSPISYEFSPLPELDESPIEVLVHYPVVGATSEDTKSEENTKEFICEVLRKHKLCGSRTRCTFLHHHGCFRVILFRIRKLIKRYGIMIYSHNFTEKSLKGHNLSVIIYNKKAYEVLKRIISIMHKDDEEDINPRLLRNSFRIKLGKNAWLLISPSFGEENERILGPSLAHLIINEIKAVCSNEKIKELLISTPVCRGEIIDNILKCCKERVKIRVLVDYDQSADIDESTREIIERSGEIRAIRGLYHRFIIIGNSVFITTSNLTIKGMIHKISLALVIHNPRYAAEFKSHFNELWKRSTIPSAYKEIKNRGKSKVTKGTEIPSFVRRGKVSQIVQKPREQKGKKEFRAEVSKEKEKASPSRLIKVNISMDNSLLSEISQESSKKYHYILAKAEINEIPIMLTISPINDQIVKHVEIFYPPNGRLHYIKELRKKETISIPLNTSQRKQAIKIFINKNEAYLIYLEVLKISLKPRKSVYLPGEEITVNLINPLKDRDYTIVFELPSNENTEVYHIPLARNPQKISVPKDLRGKVKLLVKDSKGNTYGPGISFVIKYIGEKIYIGRRSMRFYVNKVLDCLHHHKRVSIMARGKFISKAVDVAETVCEGRNIYKDININTEEIKTSDGKPKRVSAIEITLYRAQ